MSEESLDLRDEAQDAAEAKAKFPQGSRVTVVNADYADETGTVLSVDGPDGNGDTIVRISWDSGDERMPSELPYDVLELMATE
jgi:hypothetical protein